MKRRQFLKGAAAFAAVGGGVGATLIGERPAGAFGEVPKGGDASMVPPSMQAKSILEIFLYGGVSQYESFYCVPELGQAKGEGWSLFLNSGDIQKSVTDCGLTGQLIQPFAADANGKMVNFGPNVMPIRNRPDVMSRCRVAITQHDLEPHEGAIPLALAGRGLGHPALAGLGSHIQRYFLDRNEDPTRAPFSYVLLSNSLNAFPTDNIRSAIAIGMHPGAARPLSLKVDAAGDLTQLLLRNGVPDRAAYDALMDRHIAQYQKRITYPGQADPLRSPRFVDLVAGQSSIENADAISAVLEPQFFQQFGGSECGDANGTDATTMNMNLAAHLLTHPTSPAKYVCVLDGGLLTADGGGGYDTHFENTHTQARNLSHMLKGLLAVINQPNENDPSKIDLDDTMIVLTTEFGRTPYSQGGKGRNHWPYGYPIVFIGGPIRDTNKGVFGACGDDGRATLASSPQENRIAALMALGIWPFAQESYNVADVPGATTEIEAAALVKTRQLGIT